MKCCPPPGLVADLAHEVRIVKDLELQKLMLGFGADKGIHGAALFIAQPSLVIARAPIAHLADFTGKKLRVFAADMQQEMINEVEAAKPKFVVQVFAPGSWVARPNSPQLVFQWMKGFVQENYDLVGVAEIVSVDTTRYYWDKEATVYSRRSRDVSDALQQSPKVLVFRRKETATSTNAR